MASTIQTCLDRAGQWLNDDGGDRWPDETRLEFFNAALALIYAKRPDFFFGSYATPTLSYAIGDVNDPFPLDERALQPMAYYIASMCNATDSEDSSPQKVGMFAELFAAELS